MRRVRIFGLWLAIIVGLAGCNLAITPSTPAAPAATTELTVFAAASLTDAFNEIGKNFEAANPGVKLTFNYAGSQQLAQQLGQGAPADVFASANGKQMDVAIQAGRIVTGTAHTFARNRLIVIAPKDNPAQVNTLQDLAKPGLKLVFAAKEVPVGQYALDFLDKATKDGSMGADYRETVLANVVSYEDNVRSVLAKITLGEGDAGIVYSTDTYSVTDKVQSIEIPDNLNTLASYPIAAVTDSAHFDLAKKFAEYTFTPEAQTVLVKYGFIPTTGSATGAAPAALPVEISGFGGVDRDLEQAAALDGANRWNIFRYITIPLAWPILFSGMVMTWARTLGEFGATIIFAGNFPGRTQTIPLAIYIGFELDFDVALTLSVILLVISFCVLLLVKGVLRQQVSTL